MTHDWGKVVADLERLLKLRSIPFGMKLYEHQEEMEAIHRQLRAGETGEQSARQHSQQLHPHDAHADRARRVLVFADCA